MISAGYGSGDLLKKLRADDHALHRQLIPWNFQGDPSVFMSGRFVRLEAGWPDGLAQTDVLLSDLGSGGRGDGRWIAGLNEQGATITLRLDKEVPHYLFGGYTGSGKTYAMRTALAQLSLDPGNRLVMIDGKHGAGLKLLENLPNVVGPVAVNGEQARRALSWAVGQMRVRYEKIASGNAGNGNGHVKRIIVVIDEIQEFTKHDPVIVELVRILAAQGREAGVHLIIGTQHPKADAFGDESGIKRNLPGRLALLTEDYIASQVVVGDSTPRADRLMGRGDAYAITPGRLQRTQLAYIPDYELAKAWCNATPDLSEWPEFDPEASGTLSVEDDTPKWTYSAEELGVGLIQAHLGHGRPTLQNALEAAGLGKPGSVRADRLLGMARDVYTQLQALHFDLIHTAYKDDSKSNE